jgi:hypothetical protein
MTYPDGAHEVEFADRDGRAFAILSLRPEQLMVLHDTPRLRCRVRTSLDLPRKVLSGLVGVHVHHRSRWSVDHR